jgi:YegS/Rv2252/BmrU family lipid kinase
MNAIFLYSEAPGNGKIIKRISYIEKKLSKIFSKVTLVKANNLFELADNAKKACSKYDVLIFAGGDGTFHRIVNAIAKEENRPILGYISSGTLNDFGKNFGINRRISKSLKIIKKGKKLPFDVGLINGKTYFAFVAAIGAFSEISYATKRGRVKIFGKMAYYVNAVKDAVAPQSFDVKIVIDNVTYEHKVPFLLLLNGKYIGGFPISLRNKVDDGKFDLYLTKPGLFNGLLNYLFMKRHTSYYRVDKITILPSIQTPWCVDGEEGTTGPIDIVLLKKHISIFTNR